MSRAKVNEGETLSSLLKKTGFTDSEIREVWRQNPLPKNFRILPEEPYIVVNDGKEKLKGIKFFEQLSDYSYYLFKSNEGGKVGTKRILESFRTEVATFRGKIIGSILNSIQNIVGNDWVAFRFLDAYIFDMNPRRDLSRGAGFSIKVEKKFLGEQFVKFGEILETDLELHGQQAKRKFVSFSDGGVFLDANNPKANENKELYAPVNYIRVSSIFQMHRFHPIRQKSRAHLGTDFELPIGSEVFASYSGFIEKIGKNRAAGNFVVISHPNGYKTSYLHLNSVDSNLSVGKKIQVGQIIGEVGCTGYCTSPHLHFSVKRGNRAIDPLKVIKRYPYGFAEKIVSSLTTKL